MIDQQPAQTELTEQDAATVECLMHQTNADDAMSEVMRTLDTMARDRDEQLIFWYLRARYRAQQEIVRIREQTDAMIKSLESRVRGLDYCYLQKAEAYARANLTGKTKSVRTPYATLQFRSVKAMLVVTNEERLRGAATVIPGALEPVPPKLIKAAIDKHWEETGEIPPGCDVRPAGESFSIK